MPTAPHTSSQRPRGPKAHHRPGEIPGAARLRSVHGCGRALQGADAGTALPDWYQLIPPGVSSGRDGRGPYHLVDPSAVVAAFTADYPPGSDQAAPIDYDHADLKRPTGADLPPAAGWIAEVRCAADGSIEGRIEWTDRARAMIAAREIRYLSPELLVDPTTGCIVGISGAGLTHRPNLNIRALHARGLYAYPATMETSPVDADDLLEELVRLFRLPALSTIETVTGQVQLLATRLSAEGAPAQAASLVPQGATPAETIVALSALGGRISALREACALDPAATPIVVLQAAVSRLDAETSDRLLQSAALDTLRTGLGLAPAAGQSALTPAEIATQAVARVRALETAAADRDARELVAGAMRDRLIEPAKQAWAEGYAKKDPEGFRSYLKGCAPIIRETQGRQSTQADAADTEFEALVTAAQSAQGLSRGQAMIQIARSHPEAHRAWIESTQPASGR